MPSFTLSSKLSLPVLPQDQYRLYVEVLATDYTPYVMVTLPGASDSFVCIATLAQMQEIPASVADGYGPQATGPVVGVVGAAGTQAYLAGSNSVSVGAAATGCEPCSAPRQLVPFVREKSYTFFLRRKDDADEVMGLLIERLQKLAREVEAPLEETTTFIVTQDGVTTLP